MHCFRGTMGRPGNLTLAIEAQNEFILVSEETR